jgi:hypothetical protein
MKQLPKPPSVDPFAEIMHLLGSFIRDLEKHMEGTTDEDGLLQSIAPLQQKFKKTIRSTAPEFQPFERRFAESRSFPSPTFLGNEEEVLEAVSKTASNPIYLDEVLARASRYVQV